MSHSYASIANELRHKYRDDLNHAEHQHDVDSAFSLVVRQLLVQALDDSLTFTDNDICLMPDKDDGFELMPVIRDATIFKAAAKQSDLQEIIARFAESAAHRKLSLPKHEERFRAQPPKSH